MNNGNIPYCSIAVLLFTVLLSSCLRETTVPIESAFSIESSEDKTSPVTIQLKNESYGADEYEWTFEGGIPSSSNERTPAKVVFTQAGEYKITLRVWNAVEERTSQQTIRVDSAMTIDFDFTVAINNIAPGTVSVINKSKGGSQYEWTFEGGIPSTSNQQFPTDETTAIRFEHAGTYKLQMIAGKGKEEKVVEKNIVIKPNSGIIKQNDLKFGINEAKNNVGCFSSALVNVFVKKYS